MNVALPVPESPIDYGTLNARPTNAMKMNIATSSSPLPQNPTNDGTLNAPVTNGMKMNIAASASSISQHSTNDCSDTSCVEDTEKKLIMGTANLSIPSGQHVVCRPWNPEMTLPQDAEMLFRDDRFIAYRLVKP